MVDIKVAQETTRMRALVRDGIYPFLLELNETIGYSKIFIQMMATTVESTFEASKKDVKVRDLMPKYKELFNKDSDEHKKYLSFLDKFGDETVSSFVGLLQMMPRFIESHFTKEVDKRPILDLPIDKVLG